MPLELGIFLAAKYYGREEHDRKRCIIFEAKAHTYEKFISDIKGQDISAHNNSPEKIVKMIRDWLATCSPKATIIGGNAVWRDYGLFSTWLPKQCRKKRLTLSTLIFGDYINLIYEWIESRS
ncbi:MAG TPA: hypothetical protein PKC67_04950 [Kiritimatiellia bacterium]|nr:hypothetical protein [Kiritimatiellia bacterium]HMP33680.1 hypothetical protein [Kiritimatiellia bacterium]